MESVTIGRRDGQSGSTRGHADKNRSSTESILKELSRQTKDLIAQFNAVLQKLDVDTGVTDTDYESLHEVSASKITD